jgi:hypothetical protein
MRNHPLTNARLPEDTDAPLGGTQIQNAIRDQDPFIIPNFTTASARNTAYAAWVTTGGTMRTGLHCVVNGETQVYRNGAWEPLVPPATIASMRNIGGTALTASQWTIIPFTIEDVDTDNGHSTTSNNSRWYAQKARWYVASAQVSFTHSVTTSLSYRGARIRRNGDTGQMQGASTLLPVAANGRVSVSTSSIPVWMNVGDWIDVQAYHNADDAITTYSDGNFATALHIFSHR